MKPFMTVAEAAAALDLSTSRILKLCKAGRLGQSTARHGRAWTITAKEITAFRKIGPLTPGPKKQS